MNLLKNILDNGDNVVEKESNKEKKYVNSVIKKAEKNSNGSQEAYEDYLISHNICPKCKRVSLVNSGGEIYCKICGTVYNDVVYYESHGTEFDDARNRKEIYTPPSNLRNSATPYYNMDLRGTKMSSSAKYKFYKLRKMNYLVNASFSKNSQIVKKIRTLSNSVIQAKDAETRNLLIESVLMFYSKLQKRFRGWKKINVDAVLYIVSQQLGLKLDLKKLYEYEGDNKISLNKFKRNIKRGVEKIFSILTEEEKKELKRFMLKQIIKETRIRDISEKDVEKMMDLIDEIYKIYPNITFYDSIKTILSHVYRHKNYKSLPAGINEKINEIIDKKFKK